MAYFDWGGVNDLLTKYHADEWGVPVHDDRKQFEFLMMEAALQLPRRKWGASFH